VCVVCVVLQVNLKKAHKQYMKSRSVIDKYKQEVSYLVKKLKKRDNEVQKEKEE
jgi:uncharacterized coiled-coil protein SlyX